MGFARPSEAGSGMVLVELLGRHAIDLESRATDVLSGFPSILRRRVDLRCRFVKPPVLFEVTDA
ncbi:hypothetical protein Pla52n_15800 [Stieleria varia]|uniref:Uncharacterized protein n=1 Tax=Stieleria varia TaxID=2528005 RepID=A0A5C6B0N4_9BACT|nr:hypothetical protein Pla52n_15800 [Stieleria varia]